MSWVHFCTLIDTTPLQVAKDGSLEYAAIEVRRRDHKLSYAHGIVSLRSRLPVQAGPMELRSDSPLISKLHFSLRQYIFSGAELKRTIELWTYARSYEADFTREAAAQVPALRKVMRR